MIVNGERVEQVRGVKLGHRTWLSRPQINRFFQRIGLNEDTFHGKTRVYRGTQYTRAADVTSWLSQMRDNSAFENQKLTVTLQSGEHYSYALAGDMIRQNSVVLNRKLVGNVLTIGHNGTYYVLISRLSQLLGTVGISATWNGKTQTLSFAKNGETSSIAIDDPSHYARIQFSGGKSIYAPVYAWGGWSYVPMESVSAVLRQMGWTSSFDTWTWTLNSSAVRNQPNTVLAFVPSYSGSLSSWKDVLSRPSSYNTLAADSWTLDPSGSLTSDLPFGTESQFETDGDTVYAMFTNTGRGGATGKDMTSILSNQGKQEQLTQDIVQVTNSEGWAGATLDFESLPAADRMLFTTFVSGLASELHGYGKTLQVVVPANTGTRNDWNGAFDQTALGAVADSIIIMAYDYSYPASPPGPIAPLPWVQQVLAYTVSRVPAQKVVLGLDSYGYDWHGKSANAAGLSEIDTFMQKNHITPQWNAQSDAPWFTWTDSTGLKHIVYYENAKSTRAKLTLAQDYGISGVAVWRAGLEDDVLLNALSEYGQH